MIVSFVTFGCRLNRAEALDLEARFQAEGHTVVPLPSSPDEIVPEMIIVRGCSVTARAQRDCEKAIARLHKRFPAAQICPTGCLPSAQALPLSLDADFRVSLQTSRAYLKVQDGCSGRCAFCIVPQFRGPPVSVPLGTVLARAQAFLHAGFRELVITGCNLALYRSEGKGLPELLEALATLPNSPAPYRLRLGSWEPGICDAALLNAFARHPNICRFIHLSVQSGADRVLAAMNRPYTRATLQDFRAKALALLGSRMSLGADLIAGFPGETPADHHATLDLLRPEEDLLPFTNLHVFPYSERPGTVAATLPNPVPRALRLARATELEQQGQPLRAAFAASFQDQEVEVCVERNRTGWTSEYLRCQLPAGLPRRSLVRLNVKRVQGEQLVTKV